MFSKSKRLGLQLQGGACPLWWQCNQREGTEPQSQINEVNLFETPVHFDSHGILPRKFVWHLIVWTKTNQNRGLPGFRWISMMYCPSISLEIFGPIFLPNSYFTRGSKPQPKQLQWCSNESNSRCHGLQASRSTRSHAARCSRKVELKSNKISRIILLRTRSSSCNSGGVQESEQKSTKEIPKIPQMAVVLYLTFGIHATSEVW